MIPAPRIALVDSGVHAAHPHVNGIAGGITVTDAGYGDGCEDTLGHGTAIAAVIRNLAPSAELFAVRVFDRALATSMDRVLRAIDWCIHYDIRIINLSLGTTNVSHRERFVEAVQRVHQAGAVLVSAGHANGEPMLPGCLPGVIAVVPDPGCPRDAYRVTEYQSKTVFSACPFPREIPGVPRDRNLQGVSFAVAHVAAHLARRWSDTIAPAEWEHELTRHAANSPAPKPSDGYSYAPGSPVAMGSRS